MSQYADDLHILRGRVSASRPGLTGDLIKNWLNDRLRQVLDHRTIWADLLKPGILSFPDAYTTGAVTVATASTTVTGVADSAGVLPNWPVNDVVNTTIPDGVPEFGVAEVAPASMTGITENSLLYVDAAVDPEIVPVLQVNRASFVAKFAKTHNANCTVTQSSLANQQFRISASYPVFTVGAVTAATSLELMLPWGGPALAAQTYTIKLMYVMLASDMKSIIAMKDEASGYPVRLHISLDEANYRDPRRSQVSGNPWYSLVDLGANDQGNLIYEMWPAPATARQFSYFYSKQWPDMEKDTDRPPPFINPSILFYGALADAKMMRTGPKDPYYDPVGSQYYEARFRQAAQDAVNADEAKVLSAMRSPWWKSFMQNVDQLQLNDPAMLSFWSDSSY